MKHDVVQAHAGISVETCLPAVKLHGAPGMRRDDVGVETRRYSRVLSEIGVA